MEECGRRGNSDSDPIKKSSGYLEREDHRELGLVRNSCDAAGDDDPSPAGAGHDGFVKIIQSPPVGNCDRICSGGSVSNGGPGHTFGGVIAGR